MLDSRSPLESGREALAAGDQAQALSLLQEAVALAPDSWEGHMLLGVSLWAMGSREEGIRSLQRAVALNSDSARAHFNLGMMLQQTDRIAEALEQFEAALEAAPDYQAAARALQELRDRGAAPQPVAEAGQRSADAAPQAAHQSAQRDGRVPVPPSPEESVEPGHGTVGCAVELAGSDSSEPVPGEWEDEHAFLHWWGDVLDRCARMGDPEGSAGAEHRGPFARLVGWCRRWRGMH